MEIINLTSEVSFGISQIRNDLVLSFILMLNFNPSLYLGLDFEGLLFEASNLFYKNGVLLSKSKV
jgi:hypothetical protein